MKILSHAASFYSKCLAKMKNERPGWQCFLTNKTLEQIMGKLEYCHKRLEAWKKMLYLIAILGGDTEWCTGR